MYCTTPNITVCLYLTNLKTIGEEKNKCFCVGNWCKSCVENKESLKKDANKSLYCTLCFDDSFFS